MDQLRQLFGLVLLKEMSTVPNGRVRLTFGAGNTRLEHAVAATRDWIDRRWAWLEDQFGVERLHTSPLVLPNPEEFLREPSVPVDWRQPAERRERGDRRDDQSRMPVASAVPPPSAREEAPDSSEEPASPSEPPSSSPDTNALPPYPIPRLGEH